MKVISWLMILAGIVYGCASQDSQVDNQEKDLAVGGQVAQLCTYQPRAVYDPAFNPLDHPMDIYGREFKNFCVWFTIANKSQRSLIFDEIKTAWFINGHFLTDSIKARAGKRFVIPSGGQRQFSFVSYDARKFLSEKGNGEVYFCFTLETIKKSPRDKAKVCGPFVSNNFLPITNLLVCPQDRINPQSGGQYNPLRFFLVRDDFIINNLKKISVK